MCQSEAQETEGNGKHCQFVWFGDKKVLPYKEDLDDIPLLKEKKEESGSELLLDLSLVFHSGCNLLNLQLQSNQLVEGRQTSILVQH